MSGIQANDENSTMHWGLTLWNKNPQKWNNNNNNNNFPPNRTSAGVQVLFPGLPIPSLKIQGMTTATTFQKLFFFFSYSELFFLPTWLRLR